MSRRPGRIKEIVPVDFPAPRWEHDPRANPRFGELRDQIWGLLREEAAAAEPVASGGAA
jgi:NitT/TauT family transport system ATP-binding protein